jgi:hypothetical protein
MTNWGRGIRVGAGLALLGYGIYRLSRGRRDWIASSSVTSGLSATLTGLTGRKIPQLRRTIAHTTPQLLADTAQVALQALR